MRENKSNDFKPFVNNIIIILCTIYSVVIMSTDASFDGDGVIAGDDGGCLSMPGLPTVFFNTISMFVNADET